MTVNDLLRDALLEIAVVDPIDPVDSDIQTLALTRVNSILDQWNAKQIATYVLPFTDVTLTPNLNPHTIGPSAATFTVTQRPVALLGANILLNSGTTLVKVPVHLRDNRWWLKQPVPNVTSSIPTDLYYEPDWPNGSLYFWPTPTVAYGFEFEARFVLAALALGATFTMPPGYQRALTLTLAEDLATPLTVPMPIELPGKARMARADIFSNNNAPQRIATRQAGMPGGSSSSGGFNWRTGQGGGR